LKKKFEDNKSPITATSKPTVTVPQVPPTIPKVKVPIQDDFTGYSPLGVFGVTVWISIFVFVFFTRIRSSNRFISNSSSMTASDTKEV